MTHYFDLIIKLADPLIFNLMSKVTQSQLEESCSLRKAKEIVNEYENNFNDYTNNDVYSKSGVVKILSEEYCPLVTFASSGLGVRSLRFFAESNPGPDAEIKYWWRSKRIIQITCSNEGYDRALQRELLNQGKTVFLGQTRKRNKVTKKIEISGRVLEVPNIRLQQRVERILCKIEKKEKKFYQGTDTLIIQEDPANFKYLSGLHKQVSEAVNSGYGKSYRNIYIIYGQEVKRVK